MARNGERYFACLSITKGVKIYKMEKILIYTDGGSRGNPGPSAIGVVINDKGYSEYIGEGTNNDAEYKAAIFALKKTKALLGKERLKEAEIELKSDSELLVKQMKIAISIFWFCSNFLQVMWKRWWQGKYEKVEDIVFDTKELRDLKKEGDSNKPRILVPLRLTFTFLLLPVIFTVFSMG